MEDPADTAKLIFDRARDGPARQAATADALDDKAFQIFSAATILLGLGAFIFRQSPPKAAVALYGAAVGAYVAAAILTWMVIRLVGLWVVDAADRWWPSYASYNAAVVRAQLLDDLAGAATYNRDRIRRKAEPVEWLLVAVAAEAVLLGLAAVVGAVA